MAPRGFPFYAAKRNSTLNVTFSDGINLVPYHTGDTYGSAGPKITRIKDGVSYYIQRVRLPKPRNQPRKRKYEQKYGHILLKDFI